MTNDIKARLKVLGTKEAASGLGDVADAADDAADSVGKVNDRLRDSKGKFTKAGRAARGAGKQVRQSGKDAQSASAHYGELGSKLSMMAAGAAAAAAAVAGIAFVSLGKGAIQASGEMERFESQLSVLLKSSEKAKIRLAELFEIGSTTPFELGDLVKADQILTSFGADAGKMREGVMDLAGALGGELPDAAMAVAKSFGAGMGASDQLRESYALLFQDVKKRAAELGDASDINVWRTALVDALRATDGVVKGGTAKLAATFEGQLSNVADAWFKFKKQVGDAGLFDYAKLGIAELIEGMNSGTKAGERLTDVLSSALIDAIEGTVRVLSLLAGAVAVVAMSITSLVALLKGLLLMLAKARLAWLELQQAMDFFGELEGDGLVAKQFAAELQHAQERVDGMTESVRRSERAMGAYFDSIMAMGRVGDTLDGVREKFEQLEAAKVSEARATTKAQANILREMSLSSAHFRGEEEKPTKPAESGSKKKGKSADQKLFEDLEKQLKKLIPKETLTDVQKLDALLVDLGAGLKSTRKSASRDWEGLIATAERAREVAVKAATDEKAKENAKEIAKLSQAMSKAGESARKSALQVSGQWKESDSLAEKISKAVVEINRFKVEADRIGMSSADAQRHLSSMRDNLGELTKARQKALEEERKITEAEIRKGLPALQQAFAGIGEWAKGIASDFREGFGQGMKGLASQFGTLLSGVAQLGSGGIGGMVGSAGPVGAGIAGIASLGSMGYTKTEEFTDERTGETRTREVEVSAAEAIGEQMKGFLDGFILGIVEVLPELIGTIIPDFIAEGVPALIEGVFQAIPKLIFALVVKLPAALARGIWSWWKTVWEHIKEFFGKVLEGGGSILGGAAIGAGLGSVIPGLGTVAGGIIGGAAGFVSSLFHSGGYADKNYGMGTVDRTGPAILKQGERVVPPTGADTQTARQNGLAAFMPRGATVNIHTAAIDPDVVDRLGVMLDEHFGYGGRNTLPLFGGSDG